jgi:hypothetical protein
MHQRFDVEVRELQLDTVLASKYSSVLRKVFNLEKSSPSVYVQLELNQDL